MSYDYQQQPTQQYAPPRKAVTKTRKDTSHLLHLVLTIFTGGLWGVCVWLPLTVWHKVGPKEKTVTRYR